MTDEETYVSDEEFVILKLGTKKTYFRLRDAQIEVENLYGRDVSRTKCYNILQKCVAKRYLNYSAPLYSLTERIKQLGGQDNGTNNQEEVGTTDRGNETERVTPSEEPQDQERGEERGTTETEG